MCLPEIKFPLATHSADLTQKLNRVCAAKQSRQCKAIKTKGIRQGARRGRVSDRLHGSMEVGSVAFARAQRFQTSVSLIINNCLSLAQLRQDTS